MTIMYTNISYLRHYSNDGATRYVLPISYAVQGYSPVARISSSFNYLPVTAAGCNRCMDGAVVSAQYTQPLEWFVLLIISTKAGILQMRGSDYYSLHVR